MAEKSITPQHPHHEAVIEILTSLIAGTMCGKDAIEQLEMLHAEPWLIGSVRKIEAMFAPPEDDDYLGPCGSVVIKIEGAA